MRALTAGLVAAVLAASVAVGQDSRPPSELSLFTRLNGVPQRYTLADGGASSLAAASGVTCIPVSNRDVLLVVGCTADVNVCAASTDGGCSATVTDPNFGVPLKTTERQYIVVDRFTSSTLCAVAAGAYNCPIFRLR